MTEGNQQPKQADPDFALFQELLDQARNGDSDALGTLLDEHRDYLLLIVNQEVDNQIRGKIGCSDIVQETLLTANEKFSDFYGDDQQQLKAWLRRIVVNDVYEARRKYQGTEKRKLSRERQIQVESSLQYQLVDPEYTPKTNAIAEEEARKLQKAISQLPDDYREVIQLRNWKQMSFADVGKQLSRSEDAARKLWTRAILKLQEIMDE